MKFLLLNWGDRKNPYGGGAEIHLEEIFSRIAKKGHEITLLCSEFKGCKKNEIIDNINIIRVGKRSTFNFDVKRFYIKNLRNKNYDIIVDDINKIPFYSPLWVKNPVLPIVPHLFGTTVFREVSFPLALYVYLWEKRLLKVYGKHVIEVISDSTKDDLIERGFYPENIKVVLCGINHNKYKPGNKKSDIPLIVFVGRLKKYKGIDIAIKSVSEVIKKIKNLKFIIIGSGDAQPYLEKVAQKYLPKSCYKFTGFISQEEKIKYLQEAHVVLNPSVKEGWGLTGVEANACGTVVVASDSPGIRDSLINGKTGILVKHGDIKAMSKEIIKFLQQDKLRKIFEINAIKRTKELTWIRSASETLEIIKSIIK